MGEGTMVLKAAAVNMLADAEVRTPLPDNPIPCFHALSELGACL